jgi:hypothetical protein
MNTIRTNAFRRNSSMLLNGKKEVIYSEPIEAEGLSRHIQICMR